MSDRLPLPRPGSLGLIQYAGVDMHAYADAEKAALRAELERLKTVPMKYRRMAFNAQLQTENAALREALTHIERVMGPTVPPCCDGCHYEWGEALKTVRAALGEKK